MNILFIDYLSLPGHRNFNKIHIDSLLDLGHSINVLGRKGQFDGYNGKEKVIVSTIPGFFYRKIFFSQLTSRIQGIVILLWVIFMFKSKKYDYVIVPTYDILSLWVYRVHGRVVLINHNNIGQLTNKIKLFLTRTLPSNYIHVVLNKSMQQRLKEILPDKKVEYVPHGVVNKELDTMRPSFIGEGESFFFCPVNTNFSKRYLASLFESSEFLHFLQEHNLKLFVKEIQGVKEHLGTICIVPNNITTNEYYYMLSNSKAVILPYGDNFIYRCSGIFFECVYFDTPVLTTKIPDMLIYKDICCTYYFDDIKELVSEASKILNEDHPIFNKEFFYPASYWSSIIL